MTLTDLQALASTDEGRERIRVMVAELMGWRNEVRPHFLFHKETVLFWARPRESTFLWSSKVLPDYTTSLDACAEFEAGLSGPTERLRYAWNLRSVTNTGWPFTAFASALHRCMAFILTKQSTKGAE